MHTNRHFISKKHLKQSSVPKACFGLEKFKDFACIPLLFVSFQKGMNPTIRRHIPFVC